MHNIPRLRIFAIIGALIVSLASARAQVPANPAFSLAAGSYSGEQELFIGSSTTGSTIYFTIDGSDPQTAAYPLLGRIGHQGVRVALTQQITMNGSVTIKARAKGAGSGGTWSALGQATYNLLFPEGFINAGSSHAFALPFQRGPVWNWGANTFRQLADGTTTSRTTPVQALANVGYPIPNALSAAGGPFHSLAVTSAGSVLTWGLNDHGQRGTGVVNASGAEPSYPSTASSPSMLGIIEADGGGHHNVAVNRLGRVWAWGRADEGQIGDGTRGNTNGIRATPREVLNGSSGSFLSNVKQVVAGGSQTLALRYDGTVMGWGNNSTNQIGKWMPGTAFSPTDSLYPTGVYIDGVYNTHVTQIAAGSATGYAVTTAGTVFSWGDNTYGNCGHGPTAVGTPKISSQVVKLSDNQPLTSVVKVAAGHGHALALTADGKVWGWGRNYYGAVGAGQSNPQNIQAAVPVLDAQGNQLEGIVSIAAAEEYSLALRENGTIVEWGQRYGGATFPTPLYSPTAVPGSLVISNQPPVVSFDVSLLNPERYIPGTANGQPVYVAPAVLKLKVVATDPQMIQSVKFYSITGSTQTLLGSGSSSGQAANTYVLNTTIYQTATIQAEVTDGGGAIGFVDLVVQIIPDTVSLASAPASTPEDASGAPAKFTLTRGMPVGPLAVNFAIGGSAVNGTDYQSILGSVTFPDGVVTREVSIIGKADLLTESNEVVTLTLQPGTHPNVYTIGTTAPVSVTVTEVAPVVLSITRIGDAVEGSGTYPSTPGVFRVARTGNTANALPFQFTLSGSAIAGTDYPLFVGNSGVIPAGSVSTDLMVSPYTDASEGTESVIATLAPSSSGGYLVAPGAGSATLFIRDQGLLAQNQTQRCFVDTPTAFSLNATHAGGTPLTFTVLSAPAFSTVTFAGGVATVTPNVALIQSSSAFNNQDSFQYRVTDGSSFKDLQVTIKYTAIRDGFDPSAPGFAKSIMERSDDGYVTDTTSPYTHTENNYSPDGSPIKIPFGFSVNFFGAVPMPSSSYINNNGNITFDNPSTKYTPNRLADLGRIIAPFWADVDTRGAVTLPATYGQFMVGTRKAFGVTWTRCNYYKPSGNMSADKMNTFQVVLLQVDASGQFDIEFNYERVEWETGQESDQIVPQDDGLGTFAVRTGISTGSTGVEVTGSGVAGSLLDSNLTTGLTKTRRKSTVYGRHVFQMRGTGGLPTDIPIVYAGQDVPNAGSSVTINDSYSDPATGVTYLWQELNETGVGLYAGSSPAVITGATTLHPTMTLPVARDYYFRLTVFDGVSEVSAKVKVTRLAP